MKQYSYNTKGRLPNEVSFFKDLIHNKKDPIRKYVFNLEDLKYIMKNISKFSVSYKSFIKILNLNNKDKLIELLSLSYLNYNDYTCYLSLNHEYIKEFIYMFFDYNKPIYSKESSDEIWIYPKIDIQGFISENLFSSDFSSNKNKMYLNDLTLNKLLTIFTSFTKYEYSCLEDDDMSYLFDGVNYPTLVLANIDLYEKGYIEVTEELNEIKIFLNKDKKDRSIKDKLIFDDNRDLLKHSILEFINSDSDIGMIVDKKYSLEDFL